MSTDKHKALHTALHHLERGDWDAAHKLVQGDDSKEGCWIHGIVHVLEGDLANARYWYTRAERKFSTDEATEIAAAKQALA